MFIEAGVLIHIYQGYEFLEQAEQYLKLEKKPDVIGDAKEVGRRSQLEERLHLLQEQWVLQSEMVDNSGSPLQILFGPVFCYLAVQSGHLNLKRASIRALLRAPSPIFLRHAIAPSSSFGGSQTGTGLTHEFPL